LVGVFVALGEISIGWLALAGGGLLLVALMRALGVSGILAFVPHYSFGSQLWSQESTQPWRASLSPS